MISFTHWKTHEVSTKGPLTLNILYKEFCSSFPDDTYVDNDVRPGFTLRFNGSGDPTECVNLLNIYLSKVPAGRCYPKPCAIGPAYQPSIGHAKPFYGLGGYVKNIKPRGVLDAHNLFAPSDLRRVSIEYCKKV